MLYLFLSEIVILIFMGERVAGVTDEEFMHRVPFQTLGLLRIDTCIYDFNGWLLAIICRDPQKAFDNQFFMNNGYDALPSSNQVYITDLIRLNDQIQ